MMNFLTQWNMFNRLCDGILPIKAQIVYYKLLKWSNYFGLGEPFQLTNRRIMVDCEMSREKSFIDARNLLKQKGFIDFKAGKKGSPTTYTLLDLTKYTFNLQVNTEVNTEVYSEVKSEVNTEVKTEVKNDFLLIPNNNKTKTKQKEKDTEKENVQFDIFWKAYPVRKGKERARKAFEKVMEKKVPLDVILEKIEIQKRSRQWTEDNGRYIPHPATWLNGGMWEDEEDDYIPPIPDAAFGQQPKPAPKEVDIFHDPGWEDWEE